MAKARRISMESIIKALLDLTEAEYNSLSEMANIRHIPKHDFLIREGALVPKIFFLDSGAIRAYRYVDGIDYTHFFFSDQKIVLGNMSNVRHFA
ncbi:MAG: hypothetical protein AAFP19_22725 [Bacteroidota bacterium]